MIVPTKNIPPMALRWLAWAAKTLRYSMVLLETWDGNKLFARYCCNASLNSSNSGKAAKIDRLTASRGTIAKTVENAKLDASCIVLAFRERLKATTIASCHGRSVEFNEALGVSVDMP